MTTLFDFEENKEFVSIELPEKKGIIKLAGTSDEPYFCGKDICNILEYKNIQDALFKNVDEDDKKTLKEVQCATHCTPLNTSNSIKIGKVYEKLDYNSGKAIYISEAGLYSLVLSSKVKFAKDFKRVVCKEILPSIRKYGEFKIKSQYEKILFQKDEDVQRMQRRINRTKNLIDNLKVIEKKLEWIYIGTTQAYASERLFKIGSTERLTKRLSTYNTGRAETDGFFFCWVKKVYICKDLDYTIQNLLSKFKSKSNKEMYQGISFKDLKDIVEFICDNYDKSIEKINDFVKNRLELSLGEKDDTVPRLDLKKITTYFGNDNGINEEEVISIEDLENDDIRTELSILINSYGNQVDRKTIVSELNNKITGLDRTTIWGLIKELTNWKNSKEYCELEGKKLKIKY